MRNNLKKYYKAFTFVELIVVIAFIGVMMSVVLVSFQSSKEQRIVETEARKVAAAIREAQNYALTGKNEGGDCSLTYFNSAYVINGCVSVTYALQNDATFKNDSPLTLSFAAVWGTVSGATTATIKKGQYCVDVTVNSVGNVTESTAYTAGC